jgi:hypothetical protein
MRLRQSTQMEKDGSLNFEKFRCNESSFHYQQTLVFSLLHSKAIAKGKISIDENCNFIRKK